MSVDEFTVSDVTDVIEENDGRPQSALQHNEIRWVIADWKENELEHDLKFDDLLSSVPWKGTSMAKEKFKDKVEELIEKRKNGETEDANTNGGRSREVHELTAEEFNERFDLDKMKDRKMAHICHKWTKENANIIYSNTMVWVYDDDDGIWVEDEGLVAQTLQNLLGGQYGKHVKEEFVDGYIEVRDCYRVEWDEMGIRGSKCAVENGLLDLVEGELVRELRPDDYAIMRFPVKWEGPDADYDMFQNFLDKSVEGERIDMLQEYIGQLLHTNEYPFKKALMLLGDGDNGKGVLERIVCEMLGRDNVSHDGLDEMVSNQFGLQRLRKKTANINSDINGGVIEETSMFKKLTGRDPVRVEPKYETPFDMENPAKMMFAANSIPKVPEGQRAFYRRWLFIQFPNRFTTNPDDQYHDAIPNLDGKIAENELSGVLAWAVEGYQRLQEQGRFTGQRSAEEIRTVWNEYQDTTATFVRNYVTGGNPGAESDLEHKQRVDVMFNYYKKFIRTTPTSAGSKQELNSYITAEFRYPEAETKADRSAARDDEENARVWDGVHIPHDKREKLREMFDDELDEGGSDEDESDSSD